MTQISGHNSGANTRGDQLNAYIAGSKNRTLPPEIVDAAKKALLDYVGVAIGGSRENVSLATKKTAEAWGGVGNAQIFMGGATTPALAALVNGAMAHAMDYDDTHTDGAGHMSGPCWSAAFAMAGHHGLGETETLSGFVTAFEVMSRLGGGGVTGVGRNLHRRGFHPTSIFGRIGAAAAACAMMGLDEQRTAYALGVAATTAAGLLGSFGTDSKPFHAGKAAMDGILSAQLAENGFVSATQLFEIEGGLVDAFIQNGDVDIPPLDFDTKWAILSNGFKPFACCRATQPSIQTARELADRVADRKVAKVTAKVHPNAIVAAGKLNPQTALECKFSVPFCIALGLRGHSAVNTDFTEERMQDRTIMDIVPLVELEVVQDQLACESYMDVFMADGEVLHGETAVVLGHPDNPMDWGDLRTKFQGLVEPILGEEKTRELYETVHNFETPGSVARMTELVRGV